MTATIINLDHLASLINAADLKRFYELQGQLAGLPTTTYYKVDGQRIEIAKIKTAEEAAKVQEVYNELSEKAREYENLAESFRKTIKGLVSPLEPKRLLQFENREAMRLALGDWEYQESKRKAAEQKAAAEEAARKRAEIEAINARNKAEYEAAQTAAQDNPGYGHNSGDTEPPPKEIELPPEPKPVAQEKKKFEDVIEISIGNVDITKLDTATILHLMNSEGFKNVLHAGLTSRIKAIMKASPGEPQPVLSGVSYTANKVAKVR